MDELLPSATMIPTFSLTWPQLLLQAVTAEWDNSDLDSLHAVYQLAQQHCDGIYRPQGVPMICHLVRTSSVCLSSGLPKMLVRAALGHSLYTLFDSPTSSRRIPTEADRMEMRRRVGPEVESLIWDYNMVNFEPPFERFTTAFRDFPASVQDIIRIRVANEVENGLDGGRLYLSEWNGPDLHDSAQIIRLAQQIEMFKAADWLSVLDEHYRLGPALPVRLTQRTDTYELPLRRPGQLRLHGRLWRRIRRRLIGISDRLDGDYRKGRPRMAEWPVRRLVDRN